MGLRDSIKALGRSAAGAAVDLARYGLDQLDPILKADPPADTDEQKTSTPQVEGGGAVPTEADSEVDDPKAMVWDPFAIIEQLGYKERPTQITYGTLRSIMYRMPIVTSIIQTRLNQLASFARPQHDRYAMGYRIKLRDTAAEPTKQDKNWIRDMEKLLAHTGVCEDPRLRDNFETFIRKVMWDSLVYDQMAFEIVPNRKGQPAQWYAIDGATTRLADTSSAYLKKKLQERTRYVQIYDGMIVTEYEESELCFGVRNPRTDIRLYGYGVAELEMIMTTITSLLWAFQYNQKFFSQGSATKGILNFKGAIPEHQLKGFRRHFYSMLTGVENAWRTPITNADEIQWVSVGETNKDMEFSAWADFNIKVACAAYQMNPIELNFQYGNVGQKSQISESNNKWKITESRQRGLYPLLRFLSDQINTHIVWPTNPNFELEFVGLDAGTQEDTAKLNQMRVKTTRTVDELRAEDDLEPLPDGLGEVILDPTWLQHAQAKQAQADQASQASAMGATMPNMPPEAGGDEEGQPPAGEEDQQGKEGGGFDFQSLFGQEGEEGGQPAEAAKPAKSALGEKVKKSLIEIDL